MASIIYQFVISGPRLKEPRTVDLETHGVAVIGRSRDNDIIANHPLVSRHHARFEASPQGFQVTDLGTANGTLVNGEPIAAQVPVTLQVGDVVDVGPFRIVLSQQIDGKPDAFATSAVHATFPSVNGHLNSKAQPAVEEKPYESPAGLSREHSYYLQYLPEIFHSHFMTRFMALIESIYVPIEWNVDNFDLFFDPRTAPPEFLNWLANWFTLSFDSTWDEAKRRKMLTEAHAIYARRGTKFALRRALEIYTDHTPIIDDASSGLSPYTFSIYLPCRASDVNRTLVEQLIDASKPAHTTYELSFAG